MANTTSAKKATRKNARRTIINKARRTKLRGAVRTVEEAIKTGDRNAALEGDEARRAGTDAGGAAQHHSPQQREPKGFAADASDREARASELIVELTKSENRQGPGSPGFFFCATLALRSHCWPMRHVDIFSAAISLTSEISRIYKFRMQRHALRKCGPSGVRHRPDLEE